MSSPDPQAWSQLCSLERFPGLVSGAGGSPFTHTSACCCSPHGQPQPCISLLSLRLALVHKTLTHCLPPACWNPLSAVGFPMGLVPPLPLPLPAQLPSLPALWWVHGPAVTQDGDGWSQGHVHRLCPRGPL